MRYYTLAMIAAAFVSMSAHAQEADSFSQGGFGDVGKIFQEMSPEQQEAVLDQAAEYQKTLEKMSPAELDALQMQLHSTTDTIDMHKIDAAKLNPAKAKSVRGVREDLNSYQTKYQRGEIKNSVVKPRNIHTRNN